MLKCKVKSIKPIGRQMAYNLTMRSSQHNYAITGGKSRVYSRNSHSAAYSYVAYQTAYLKVYYPLEYMCNLLTSEIANEDKLSIYMSEAKRMGADLCQPNINKSGKDFKIERGIKNGKDHDFLRMPLTAIKGIGDKAVEEIVLKQPFVNLKDFLSRIDLRKANSKVFGALVDEGAMDDVWNMSREEIKMKYEEIKKVVNKEKTTKKKQEVHESSFGGVSLFDKIDSTNVVF